MLEELIMPIEKKCTTLNRIWYKHIYAIQELRCFMLESYQITPPLRILTPSIQWVIWGPQNTPASYRVQPGILRAEQLQVSQVQYALQEEKIGANEGCRWWIFCPTARAKTESSRVGPKVLLKTAQDLLARRLILSFPRGVIMCWFCWSPHLAWCWAM